MLLKDCSTDDLVHAFRVAVNGGLEIYPRAALSRPPADPNPPRAESSPIVVLTRAERAVATEVATGATNSEIAETLVLAEGTVKNHVSALLRKLDQRDRTALELLLARYLDTPEPA
ncbi:MAG: LuxR C-terminal-related transcriptional regulator [Candidatus Nanopelagicales bacterium]